MVCSFDLCEPRRAGDGTFRETIPRNYGRCLTARGSNFQSGINTRHDEFRSSFSFSSTSPSTGKRPSECLEKIS